MAGGSILGKAFLPLQIGADLAGFDDASAGGIAEVVFGPVPAGMQWRVSSIAVESASAAATEAFVYNGGRELEQNPANLVDYTPEGNNDISDRQQPIHVAAGAFLRVLWTGATAAARCTAHMQYDVLQEQVRISEEVIDDTRAEGE